MEVRAAAPARLLPCLLLAGLALLALAGAGFLQPSGTPRLAPPPAQAPRLAVGRPPASAAAAEVPTASPASSSAWRAAAASLALGLLWVTRRSPGVARAATAAVGAPVQKYDIKARFVKQWEPTPIPPSARRAPEDRIRIKMFAHHPVCLLEAVECFQDLAKETGGETEGPIVERKKKIHLFINKSPKGHKKSKYHKIIEEHTWILDYYPPVDGGLDAIMRIRLPHTVQIKIE